MKRKLDVKAKIKSITTDASTADIQIYLDYYQLNWPDVYHHYEFYQIKRENIFLQSFTPREPIGRVVVLHGYLDHSGSLRNLIDHLLAKRYQVMTFDLPGHGLSSGPRAEITAFDDYVHVFEDLVNNRFKDTDLPLAFVAHSTGGAICIDYLLENFSPFEKVILLAPLVRSYRWYISRLGFLLIKHFLKEIKRVFKQNSSNQNYLEVVKQDPLQHDKLPLIWFEALHTWYRRIQQKAPSLKRIFVIQGDHDQTVDWQYNLSFIKKKFPNCTICTIHGGNHQLLNEDKLYLETTIHFIHKALEDME